MPDILDKIFCDKKIELDTVKRKLALPDVKMRIANNNYEIRDIRMLLESTTRSSIFAEIKPRTPFKGELLKNFDPVDLAKTYADNGASALSILTESSYFGGSLSTLEKARECVDIPLLRKDFIFDEYQVYEAREIGRAHV